MYHLMYEAINRSGFHGLRSLEREANLFNLEMPALHCSDEGAILERQIVGGGLLFEGQYWIAIAVENPFRHHPLSRQVHHNLVRLSVNASEYQGPARRRWGSAAGVGEP